MSWIDIKNNLGITLENQLNNSVSSITDAWDTFKNINSLSLPIINSRDLFNSVSHLSSIFSNSGTDDNVQTDLLHGLPEIWTNGNDELKKITSGGRTQWTKIKTDANGNRTVIDEKVVSDDVEDTDTYNGEWEYSGDYQSAVTNFQNISENNGYFEEVVDTSDSDRLMFLTPEWTYADFINERAIFQKSLQNPLGDQGWFYFKIFFNFDTQYGLFGGLLNNKNPMMATNSAYKYLRACESLGAYYKTNERQVALVKFAKILSYISTYAPWFFKGIRNLNQANIPVINDFTKERSIEIECATDAIDMRLNTLLDLYKFACYDEIDQKEIVPDNLRKFDMTVMVFQSPLKYFHTSFRTNTGHKYNYKGAFVNNETGFSDTMSFKMFTFINCEIDIESLGNMVPGSINNEKPFNMGGGTIKILYDRVYTHTMNEFMHIMFGNDGLYYDGSASTASLQGVDERAYRMQTALQKQRVKDIANVYDDRKISTNPNDTTTYKSIVDASESLCTNNMRALGFNALGNFAGYNKDLQFDDPNDRMKLSEYYDLKLKMLKNSPMLNETLSRVSGGVNGIITDLIESYNKMKSTVNTTWTESDKILYTDSMGHIISNSRKQTAGNLYWRNKINAMKDGYVSPETLVQRYELQKYDYLTFTKYGYGDKIINLDHKGNMVDGPGTDYWKMKIAALVDGVVSPETLEQRYEKQKYGYENISNNGSGINDKSLTTDKNGTPTPSPGTNYWLEKLRELKNGVIKSEDPYSQDYLQKKLEELTDGIVYPANLIEGNNTGRNN